MQYPHTRASNPQALFPFAVIPSFSRDKWQWDEIKPLWWRMPSPGTKDEQNTREFHEYLQELKLPAEAYQRADEKEGKAAHRHFQALVLSVENRL